MSEFDKDEFKEVTDMEETIDQNTKNESTKEKTDSVTTQETYDGNADTVTTQETSGEKEEYEEVCYIC